MGDNDKETGENEEVFEENNEEIIEEAAAEEPAETTVEETAPEAPENSTENAGNGIGNFMRGIRWKKTLIASGTAAAVLAAVYFGGVMYYQNHFFFGTSIGGVDCSNLTAGEAEEKIQQELENYTFTFYEKNGDEEVITGDEIELTHAPIENMEELLPLQNAFAWVTAQKSRNLPLNTEVSYNKDALYCRIAGMDFIAESKKNMDGSVNNIYYEDGVYRIHDDGTKDIVSINDTYAKVKPMIKELYRGISMEKSGCYKGLADDDMMKGVLNLLNKYVSASVTYKCGSSRTVLDRETINKWLSVDENYSIHIDEGKAREYVDNLANSYNTYGKERKFKTSNGETVTVSGGNYGWLVDNQKETKTLCDIIRSGEAVEREPVYRRTAAAHGANNDLSNTYVEVSIAGQHLWYYKNGNLIVSTDVVTGNSANKHDTPKGTYYIAYKDKNTVLRGEDYETPVSFWMPFNGGVGLHDATWRGAFGGNIYRGSGSHGCVNLPYGAAEKIYSSISPGDPVIVY